MPVTVLLWVLLLVPFERPLWALVSLLSSVLESELVLALSKFSSLILQSAQSVVVMMIYPVYLVVLSIRLAENDNIFGYKKLFIVLPDRKSFQVVHHH